MHAVAIIQFALICSGAGMVECRASSICAVRPDDYLGVAMSGESCCLDNPSALAYIPVGSEYCIRCIGELYVNKVKVLWSFAFSDNIINTAGI